MARAWGAYAADGTFPPGYRTSPIVGGGPTGVYTRLPSSSVNVTVGVEARAAFASGRSGCGWAYHTNPAIPATSSTATMAAVPLRIRDLVTRPRPTRRRA